jgi:hypothetical protein
MASNELTLTTAGQALISKVQAGACKIKWTKAQIGSGVWDSDLKAATALKSPKQSVDITSVAASGESTIQVRVVFSNEDMAAPFALRELGIFARGDTDPGDSDVLVGIMAFDNTAEIPAYNGSFALRQVFNLGFAISIASVATVELSSALATVKDISTEAVRAQAAEAGLQNLHKHAVYTISSSGWVASGNLYVYTQTVKGVYSDRPDIYLSPVSGNSSTDEEVAAYGQVKYATIDPDTKTLKLYASMNPGSDFAIYVKGVE